MILFDSHCHWDFPVFDADRAALLNQCYAKGITQLMIPAVSEQYWSRLLKHLGCQQQVACWGALGLHPCFMQQHRDTHLAKLDALLDNAPVTLKAVGEIGLDRRGERRDYPQQCRYFTDQLTIAASHRLPVLLHVCKAHDDALKYLRRQQWAYGGIVHAFSGSLQQAMQYQEMGFMLGFGGAATYPRAQRLARLVTSLPDDTMVLETDAPDMAPHFIESTHNSPIYLSAIADYMANLRQQPAHEFSRNCTLNTCKVLKIPMLDEERLKYLKID